MNRIAFLVAAILIAPSSYAEFIDGQKLHSLLQSNEMIRQARGTVDDAVNMQEAVGYIKGSIDSFSAGGLLCLPSNFTVGQAEAIVTKYLSDNPQDWRVPATLLIGRALIAKSYGCKGPAVKQ